MWSVFVLKMQMMHHVHFYFYNNRNRAINEFLTSTLISIFTSVLKLLKMSWCAFFDLKKWMLVRRINSLQDYLKCCDFIGFNCRLQHDNPACFCGCLTMKICEITLCLNQVKHKAKKGQNHSYNVALKHSMLFFAEKKGI